MVLMMHIFLIHDYLHVLLNCEILEWPVYLSFFYSIVSCVFQFCQQQFLNMDSHSNYLTFSFPFLALLASFQQYLPDIASISFLLILTSWFCTSQLIQRFICSIIYLVFTGLGVHDFICPLKVSLKTFSPFPVLPKCPRYIVLSLQLYQLIMPFLYLIQNLTFEIESKVKKGS